MANAVLDGNETDVSSSDSESKLALVAADMAGLSFTSKNRNNLKSPPKRSGLLSLRVYMLVNVMSMFLTQILSLSKNGMQRASGVGQW